MMRYRIIKSDAYDVTGDVIEMMSYKSEKAQNTKKRNIILSLELELLDQEHGTHFSKFQIVKGVNVSGIVERITSQLKFAKTLEEGREWWKDIAAFFIAAVEFGTKGRDVIFVWNVRRGTSSDVFVKFLL